MWQRRAFIFRIGVFGGTFNPIHFGHLRSAEEVREEFELNTVIFVTSARPPHKPEQPMPSFEHRHFMLTLALEDETLFAASDIENRRPGRSYSIQTLQQLKSTYPENTVFYFIVGLDSFLEISTWKNYIDLFAYADFVVLNRPGFDSDELEKVIYEDISKEYTFEGEKNAYHHPRLKPIHYRHTTLLDISSSRIRQSVSQGRSIRFLLPERVEQYIRERGLYSA